LPLIPPADRDEQISRWLGIGRHLFRRDRFPGFWPPELGFCMDLVPTLSAHLYEWVIVDSEHVRPLSPMRWEELRYRPHRARVGDAEIVVVVRDRDLSNAQESGMDAGWFIEEVRARTQHCNFPPLVTTATTADGFATPRAGRTSGAASTPSSPSARALGSRAASVPHSSATTSGATAPTAGSQSTPGPGTPVITTARDSCSGQARKRNATPLPGSQISATPSAPSRAKRSTASHAPRSSLNRPGGGCYAHRQAATSTGARLGCSAATTTSTRPPPTLTKRRTSSEQENNRVKVVKGQSGNPCRRGGYDCGGGGYDCGGGGRRITDSRAAN